MTPVTRPVAGAIILAACLPLVVFGPAGDLRGASIRLLLGCAVCVYGVSSVRGLWSASSVFLVILSLFHVGLALFPAFGLEAVVGSSPMSWFYGAIVPKVMWLVLLALSSFSLGSILWKRRTESGKAATGPLPPAQRGPENAGLKATAGAMGLILLAGGVVAWFAYTVRALGPSFVLASYEQYKNATSLAPMEYVFFSVSLGLVLVSATSRSWIRRVTVALFVTFAVFALPIGLRGEVLFPLAAYSVAVATRRRMPRFVLVALILIVGLSVVGIIKEVRQTGLLQAELSVSSITPVAGIGELGYTVRTVESSVRWHDVYREPFRDGETYLAPFERLASNIPMIGIRVPPARSDDRLMNVEMRAREGNIGGSVVAEAYHNFGSAGVAVVLFLIGLGMGAVDARRKTIVGDLFAGLVFIAAVQHVRNSFAPVPFQIIIGVLLLVVVIVVGQLLDRRFTPLNRSRRRVGVAAVPSRGVR